MTQHDFEPRVTSASREVAAPAAVIFVLIADPSQQPRWDGNANLVVAAPGQRVHAVGDVFVRTIHLGQDRENLSGESEAGGLIACGPSELGTRPPGHLWRWELQPIDETTTRVTHTYDWSELSDPNRLARARATTAQRLLASIDGLARLAEGP